MIKLAIAGACGRMGTAIYGLAQKNKNFQVTGLIESPRNALVGKKLGDITVQSDISKVVKDCDVVIDFTAPGSSLANVITIAKAKKAVVIGTTGFEERQREELVRIIKPIAAVISPNMSLGANLLFDFTERMAALLPGYDAEIVEIHHNLKKDAPSGTAKRLAESVKWGRKGEGRFVHGREGVTGERKAEEIGVMALRGGDVVGDHTVFFMGQGERVELIHRATSRDAFASGALTAAEWVVKQKPGLYDMRDVLGIRSRD
jgi:4-hydroxy-tetrahydrodipicolinate reductase